MRLLAIVAVLAVSLSGCFGAEPTQEDVPRGQIDGAVLSPLLFPYGNVSVHLVELDAWTTTTELGGFSFYNVPVGFHTLEVDLPGIGKDREIVAVEEDAVSKLILQIFPEQIDEPHVTVLSDAQLVQVAMPGEACATCDWRAQLRQEMPRQVEIHVEWDGRHPVLSEFETHLVVTLETQGGQILIGPLGQDDVKQVGGYFVLEASIPGNAIPVDARTLDLRFAFDEGNEAPHPDFEMRSAMCLHYGETNGPTACTPP